MLRTWVVIVRVGLRSTPLRFAGASIFFDFGDLWSPVMLQGRSFLCEIRLIELRDFPSFRFFIGLVKTESLLLLEKLIVTIRQVISQGEEVFLSLWPVVQLFDVLVLLDSW